MLIHLVLLLFKSTVPLKLQQCEAYTLSLLGVVSETSTKLSFFISVALQSSTSEEVVSERATQGNNDFISASLCNCQTSIGLVKTVSTSSIKLSRKDNGTLFGDLAPQ